MKNFFESIDNKIAAAIIGGFTLILMVFFAWQEWQYLDINKTINHEKIYNFFGILAFALTIVGIILTYRQYRLSTINTLPDIYPLDTSISLTRTYDKKNPDFDVDLISFLQISNPNLQNENAFEIVNCGSSVALNLSISWYYDEDAIYKILTEGKQAYQFIFIDEVHPNILILRNDAIARVKFPGEYIKCLPSLFDDSFARLRDNYNLQNLQRIPKLELEINYYDKMGKLITKKFKATFRAFIQQVDKNTSNISVSFSDVKNNLT